MKVLVKCPFMDAAEGLARNIGEVFECSDDRAAYLCECGLVQVASEQPEKKKPTTRKKASKED